MVSPGTLLEHEKMGTMCRTNKSQLQLIQFWVHIHDLELEKFSVENEEKIGNKIGKFIVLIRKFKIKQLAT